MKKRIYIVEDAAMARLALEEMITNNGFELAGSSSSAEAAKEFLNDGEADLYLLDINLAGNMDGLQLAEQIRERQDVPIVFLTAYGDKKTLDMIDKLDAEGYILKPYNETTVLTTLKIALKRGTIRETQVNKKHSVFIKENGANLKLYTDQIVFVMTEGNYLQITCKNNSYLIRESLSAFYAELPENFIQIHRKYVINSDYINGFDQHLKWVVLDSHKLETGRSYRQELEEKIKKAK